RPPYHSGGMEMPDFEQRLQALVVDSLIHLLDILEGGEGTAVVVLNYRREGKRLDSIEKRLRGLDVGRAIRGLVEHDLGSDRRGKPGRLDGFLKGLLQVVIPDDRQVHRRE